MAKELTLHEKRQKCEQDISNEAIYTPLYIETTRSEIFELVSNNSGVELFDKISSFLDKSIIKERNSLAEQFCIDLSRIEFYVNNAGWNTDEKRDMELSTIWGLRNKYAKLNKEL